MTILTRKLSTDLLTAASEKIFRAVFDARMRELFTPGGWRHKRANQAPQTTGYTLDPEGGEEVPGVCPLTVFSLSSAMLLVWLHRDFSSLTERGERAGNILEREGDEEETLELLLLLLCLMAAHWLWRFFFFFFSAWWRLTDSGAAAASSSLLDGGSLTLEILLRRFFIYWNLGASTQLTNQSAADWVAL